MKTEIMSPSRWPTPAPAFCNKSSPRFGRSYARGQEAPGTVPGSGLGLPLARAIVEQHAGRIRLRSRAGQGTVVTVRLPAAQNRGHKP